MAKIYFAGEDNFEKEVADGSSLQSAVDSAGADVMFGCREGTCATCMIQVHEGKENLSGPTEAEETTLLDDEIEAGIRLACQCKIMSGSVKISAADGAL